MAAGDHDSHTGRNVALVGGAALVLWLLMRGRGWGLGHGGDGAGSSAAEGAGTAATPCSVWIRADGIEVDGQAADLPTVVARCKAAGRADLNASGAALVGTIEEVIKALRAAGVVIYANPDLDYEVARAYGS